MWQLTRVVMKTIHIALISSAATLLSVMGLSAATISSAGTLADLTPASFGGGTDIADIDTAGAGTDGFILFHAVPEGGNTSGAAWNSNIIDNSPAYITGLDGSASTSSGGWAGYDDVTVGGNTYNTGGIVQSPGNGVEVPMFTFQLTGSVPSLVTLGLIVDNSDSGAWDVTNVRIEGPAAVTANQNVTTNGGTDVAQFNIGGGLPGETYTVFGTAPPSGAVIGGVTFDSIPEPGSLTLLAVSGVLLLRRRRRSTGA